MKFKNQIKTTAVLSVMSALVTVLLILGCFFDVLDLACASVASLVIHIVCNEYGYSRSALVFAVSAVLSNLFLPLRSCPIVFAAFFGYFPIIRTYLYKKIKFKKLVYVLLLLLYNAVMICIYLLFKEIFGIANEPMAVVWALLGSANLFYVAFELLLGRIMILYNYYIKRNIKGK